MSCPGKEVGGLRHASGSHFAISARELLEFVRLHLDDQTLALCGTQVESVPDFGGGASAGDSVDAHEDGVVAHRGFEGTEGFSSRLRKTEWRSRGQAVRRRIVEAQGSPRNAMTRRCGNYRNTLYDIALTVENERAFLIYRPRNELAASFLGKPEKRVEVVRLSDNAIITAEPTVARSRTVV